MICNEAHPTVSGVRCGREPGLNARTGDVVELDEDGNEISRTPGRDVHVHSGRSTDGGVHRWEDFPELP